METTTVMMVYQGQRGCLLKLLLNQSHPKHLRKMRQCCHRPTSQRSVASLRRPVLRFLLHQLRCWLRRHKPSLSKLVQIDFHKFPPDFFSWENQNTFEQWPLQVSVTRMQQLEAFPHPKAKAKAGKEGETEKKKPKGKGRGRGGGKGRGKGGGKGRGKGKGKAKVEKKAKGTGKGDDTKGKAKARAKSKGSPKSNKTAAKAKAGKSKEPKSGNKSWARRYPPKSDPAKTWYHAVKDSFQLHLHAQFAHPGQQEDSFESFCWFCSDKREIYENSLSNVLCRNHFGTSASSAWRKRRTSTWQSISISVACRPWTSWHSLTNVSVLYLTTIVCFLEPFMLQPA